MNTIKYACDYCHRKRRGAVGRVNRARKIGAPPCCDATCSGLARRNGKTTEQKKAEKATYDSKRRGTLAIELKAYRQRRYREWGPAHRDEERAKRRANMPRHIAYCRRDEYKAKKNAYDKEVRAGQYGDFAEAWRLLLELQREIIARVPDKYERLRARGYYDKVNAKIREKRRLA